MFTIIYDCEGHTGFFEEAGTIREKEEKVNPREFNYGFFDKELTSFFKEAGTTRKKWDEAIKFIEKNIKGIGKTYLKSEGIVESLKEMYDDRKDAPDDGLLSASDFTDRYGVMEKGLIEPIEEVLERLEDEKKLKVDKNNPKLVGAIDILKKVVTHIKK